MKDINRYQQNRKQNVNKVKNWFLKIFLKMTNHWQDFWKSQKPAIYKKVQNYHAKITDCLDVQKCLTIFHHFNKRMNPHIAILLDRLQHLFVVKLPVNCEWKVCCSQCGQRAIKNVCGSIVMAFPRIWGKLWMAASLCFI